MYYGQGLGETFTEPLAKIISLEWILSFFWQIVISSVDSGKNQSKEEIFSMIKSVASTTILGLWLEYSQADNSQFRNLKTIHFH